ncbi:MAG: Lrp/AsnC family transcriptional regulator [Nanoarchaeota archaeon]
MERLDLLDKKIMYELDLNARASASQIARKIRSSKETINFRINRLIKEEYIKGFYTVFNTSKLGMYYYKTFLKFNRATPEIEEKIIEFIKNYNRCAYLGSCEGYYNVIFLIMVENARQFKEFLTEFKEKFGDYILEKEIHVVLSTHRLNQKFLYAGATSKHYFYQDKIEAYPLDNLDIKIMKLLSTNARMGLVKIGEELNVDSKVVKYRMRNLEKEGVIISYTTAPNFSKLGLEFIQLNFSVIDLKKIPSIIEFFDKTNKCLFALELLGKYDLTIEIHVENDKIFRQIMEKFKERFVNEYISYDVFNIYKEHVVVWLPLEKD